VADARVRILIGDGQSLRRAPGRAGLEGQPDPAGVPVPSHGLEAGAEAERTRPDVALLDAGLPNCEGSRATSLIRERVPECRVLVLTGEEDQAALAEAVEAGASGYLTKEFPLGELIEATRAVLLPTGWLDAALAFAAGDPQRAASLYAEIGSLPDEAWARLRAAQTHASAGSPRHIPSGE
jgi:two-component system response regulator DesR